MKARLPYPGHTWSFTQHAVGLNAKTLYDFLKCAAVFEGNSRNYDEGITKLMVAAGILTPNKRDGVNDAWRDYQQLLAELGLIYSTKICKSLAITEIGHMYLAGELGFSELIGIQSLRYQYPNGQKSSIQTRLKKEFLSNSVTYPETLTELQINSQILLKPGVLILRILVELFILNQEPILSVSECQAFLIPCKQNSDWHDALKNILKNRRKAYNTSKINNHARRNLQDWFKFLKCSDFFVGNDSNIIQLSAYAMSDPLYIKNLCDAQENPSTYWYPSRFDIPEKKSWFDWFGHLPFFIQGVLRNDVFNNEDYIQKNYIEGIDDDEINSNNSSANLMPIELRNIDMQHLDRQSTFEISEIDGLLDRLISGAQKRHAKTILHDKIVKSLAEKFLSQGAIVESDPATIDLFSTWPGGESAMFEIKTVTSRSLQGRLRAAIGQVEEYSYRRNISGHKSCDRVIVLNTNLERSAWQTSFLIDHFGIGLICNPHLLYYAYAPTNAKTKEFWVK